MNCEEDGQVAAEEEEEEEDNGISVAEVRQGQSKPCV